MEDAERQICALDAMMAYEEADVDFLLNELLNAPDRDGKREAIRRFRRQMIRIASSITTPQE